MRIRPVPKLLILDLDNTLWDWVKYFGAGIEAQVAFLSQVLYEPAPVVYNAFRDVHLELGCTEHPDASITVIRRIYPHMSSADCYRFALLSRERFLLAALPSRWVYPTSIKAVSDARSLTHVVGFTDALRPNAQFRLAASGIGLDHLYAVDVDAADPQRKPSPARLLKIAEDWDVLPEECVVVGDNPHKDIKGALDAGMVSVLATHGKVEPCHALDVVHRVTSWTSEEIASQHKHVEPDFMVHSPKEIYELLASLCRVV